jgi:Tfp pilus assembly protein PilO
VQVKTKNLIVGALAVLFVGAVWFRVVYSPMENKASKAKSSAHESEITNKNLQHAIDDVSGTSKQKKAQEVAPEVLRAAVPIDAAESSFLRAVDTLRVTSGAEWQSITPSTPTPAGNVTSVNVAISVQGTEDQVTRYVAGLATLKRLFVLDNLSITPGGSTVAAGSTTPQGRPGSLFVGDTMTVQISGRIFSQPVAPAPSATTGSRAGSTTGAPAPTGAASSPPGAQNN